MAWWRLLLPSLRLGRYPVILLSLLGFLVFGFGTAFVNSFYQYLFFRFFVAQASVGYAICSVSLGDWTSRGRGGMEPNTVQGGAGGRSTWEGQPNRNPWGREQATKLSREGVTAPAPLLVARRCEGFRGECLQPYPPQQSPVPCVTPCVLLLGPCTLSPGCALVIPSRASESLAS